jgi:hypothetical protein
MWWNPWVIWKVLFHQESRMKESTTGWLAGFQGSAPKSQGEMSVRVYFSLNKTLGTSFVDEEALEDGTAEYLIAIGYIYHLFVMP